MTGHLVHMQIGDICEALDYIDVPTFVVEVLGHTLVFTKLNKCYERTVGMMSSHVEGKTAHEFLPTRIAETIETNYWRCALRGEVYEYEEFLTLEGKETWWNTSLSPVRDKAGNVRYIIGTANDISALKNETIELTNETSKLKRLNDDISTLTAIAAHDLRPAISNIREFTELVLDGFEDLGDGKRDHLETINSISDIMADYVDRILTHARSINTEPREESQFFVDHLIKDIAASSDPNSKFDISHPTGVMRGEAIVFQIILRNLIDNAVRYARSRISIDIKQSTERTGHVVISVSDDGEGFNGGKTSFQALLRINRDLHRQPKGFGLRAVQQLVEARDGLLWIGDSKLGKGATICVSIPGTREVTKAATPLYVVRNEKAEQLKQAQG